MSALVCHERTHTNERPYACSVCRQRFKYLGDKNKHERRHESLGGAGFKRIVPGRNIKLKSRDEQSSASEQEHESIKNTSATQEDSPQDMEEHYEDQHEQIVKFEQHIVKFENHEEYDDEQVYKEVNPLLI